MPNEENILEALKAAVSALYFDDGSDFKPALLKVVRELGGREAVDLLESDGSAAFQTYCQ